LSITTCVDIMSDTGQALILWIVGATFVIWFIFKVLYYYYGVCGNGYFFKRRQLWNHGKKV